MGNMNDRWIYRHRSANAQMRLFCFPYAGGGSTVYSRWCREFPDEIEVCAVELPGRRTRLREPALRRADVLVRAVADGLAPYLDLPFAFFGHSMGAIVAFELERHLRRLGQPGPRALFLSGAPAPHVHVRQRPIWTLPDDQLLAEVRAFGGIPDVVLDEPQMMELFLPILRADFEVFETYRPGQDAPADCPVFLYGGDNDDRARPADVLAWRDHVSDVTSVELFPGGHFFLTEQHGPLTASVSHALGRLLDSPAATGPR